MNVTAFEVLDNDKPLLVNVFVDGVCVGQLVTTERNRRLVEKLFSEAQFFQNKKDESHV